MAERLKDMFFTEQSLHTFADFLITQYPEFDKKSFLSKIFCEEWEAKELKERMRHTTLCLHELLPADYLEALAILEKCAPSVKGFEAMVLPDYVELYGMDFWDESLHALGFFTKFASSEFAIRPFLDKDPEKTIAYMSRWAESVDEKVRRFASEGCRPRLPWAMALPKFKKNPRPILPILEKLKNDDSEFVRRSVANNLNDISKDNPEIALELCEKWIGSSPRTDWIIKHACRSLLKAGDKRALKLFGYGDPANIQLENLSLSSTALAIGDTLEYTFALRVKSDTSTMVRLECAIEYVKSSGKTSKKIFKLTERDYAPGAHMIKRKQSFQDMSTRKHFPGKHRITILANGEEKAAATFQLI